MLNAVAHKEVKETLVFLLNSLVAQKRQPKAKISEVIQLLHTHSFILAL